MRIGNLREVLLSRRRTYQRAPDIVFNRSRIGLPPDIPTPGRPGLRALSAPQHTERVARQFEYSASDLAALNIDLAPMSMVSITGNEGSRYSFGLHAEAACDDPQQARALLERLSFTREGSTLVLRNPPSLPGVLCRSYLDVLTPADRAIVVTGTYSAVQLFGIRAPVTISTTHGKISFFETAGRVDAVANDGGWIVFEGDRGRARLNADLGIDLKLTAARFDGTLEAAANGEVRVLLPPDFLTGIEVHVRAGSQFVCRSRIRSRFRRRRAGGGRVFCYGEAPPMRLVSRQGPVIIDEIAAARANI